MDLWVRVFGWRSLHSEGTFCELAFLFSEPIQTWNSFYFPEPDLGIVGTWMEQKETWCQTQLR